MPRSSRYAVAWVLLGLACADVGPIVPGVDAASSPGDAGVAGAHPEDASGRRDASAKVDAAPIVDAAEHDTGAPPDAEPVEPWSLPVDLTAPWSLTGTAVPERAAMLAGCRVDAALAGAADPTAVLHAAIADAGARAGSGRCAVVIPAGHWTLRAMLELPSGVVLVGAGSARTRLDFDVGEVPLVAARGRGAPLLTAFGDGLGGALGEPRFAVTASIARAVSELLAREGRLYVEVSQDNDPAKFPARWAQAYAARAIGQLARVTSVTADAVVLDRPLSEHYLPGSGFRKVLLVFGPEQMVERAGLMDVALSRQRDAHDSSVLFDRTVGAFVVRVESLDTGWSHVAVDRSLACVVASSWLHGAHGHGDGGRGYGANLRLHTTGCRVEDNVLEDLRHAMIVQLGANQNVYGYNLSLDSHDDLGATKADISVHGHWAHLNLFEGNDLEYAHVADWHGPSPRQILFKNRARVLGMFVDDASERTALIDNVVESVLGRRFALRAHGSVRRVICTGNVDPDGAPLSAQGRTDCDDENARVEPPRPPSLYRGAPLAEADGTLPARARRMRGEAVPQP